ncbi:MAG: DUF4432 family protein [Thermoleophilia bacterium]|nr:DUF4432 family protein [Thermoleophilia bacterium]
MIDRRRIGHRDQVVLVTGESMVDVRVLRGIDIRLHPRRGLDIGAAWFRGVPLAWIAPAGEGGRTAADWREAWGGGLVTTCGLDNVGAPSEGIGLHGTFTFLPARDVETERSDAAAVVRAFVDEPRGLRVERTVSTAVDTGRVEIHDRVVNQAETPLEAPQLYHANLGWPLWDSGATVASDAHEVRPRDDDAARHDWRRAPEPSDEPERVWEHVGASRASVTNERLGLQVTVESDMPRLWQWIDPKPGVYALALEPANCSVLGRAHDRAEGRLPFVGRGEERTTRIVITAVEVA